MSACASAVPVPSTPNRAFCRTPVSYFDRILNLCNYTELRCLGVVLASTVGRSSQWEEIYDASFGDATGVTKDFWSQSLGEIESQGLIITRILPSGRKQYAISPNLQKESSAEKIRGRCSECGTVADFDTAFVAVPHAAFRKLGACVDHSTYVVTMLIVRNSLKWNAKEGITSRPVEMDINDFERFTGLSPTQIRKGLATAASKEFGLITRQERPGKRTIYCAVPSAFADLERRQARVIQMPKGKETAKTANPKSEDSPNKTANTPSVESVSKPYVFCANCSHFTVIEPVAADVPDSKSVQEASKVETRPPRQGPTRETARKKTKSELMIERIRAKYV